MSSKARREPTAEQKAAASARRERFRALVKSIAAMSDEQRLEIVSRIGAVVTCEARALSVFNTCLLMSQCENVSMVGGFQQWLRAGRAVRKGEHGLMIWIPSIRSASKDAPESGEIEDVELRFVIGTVFDISQTAEIQSQEVA